MAKLEDLTRGAHIKGISPDGAVTVVNVQWYGDACVELTYKRPDGAPGSEMLYRDREPTLEIVSAGPKWSFDGDGALLRLASEAKRIQLAHLFDPLMAVHSSVVEPLPHQITAVYESMLPRQPLRFLLADDPGAGKTIMAGLLMKELMARGDLERCLVVCPGSLAEQWQDELLDRFRLEFDIVGRMEIENSRSGNPFQEKPLAISRLDLLSRAEDIQEKLKQCDWDLVVVDEAHKMSAHFWGGEVRMTKRYQLGQLLGSAERTRHFLLMTATPHNGKEEDFQLFMALLDGDRFEGKFRDGVHVVDTSDMMRRLVKEKLLKFDGKPLFPERRAYTVNYKLSDAEAALYAKVTDYVTEEMNRAERLKAEGEGRRGNMVGFALTTLQRRLASSPEAIYQSLVRRRERLEKRLEEEKLLKRGAEIAGQRAASPLGAPEGSGLAAPLYEMDDPEDWDEAPSEEVEDAEEKVVDLASAAQTIQELEAEIGALIRLEAQAREVRQSGTDRKWEELSEILQAKEHMFDSAGARRKLVLFSEHKDTITYLLHRITTLLGDERAVVVIHGGMGRQDRRKTQDLFLQDKNVHVLIATDAAGEGINLQRAHLMVNYDLPWNPNRLEQRFGRIHRIGQTEVCHLWNLVAEETREGAVYHTLLKKLEEESAALHGQVFDVLGKLFRERPLRELLLEAIRYGDQPEIRARLQREVEGETAPEHIRSLYDDHALVHDSMDASKVQRIREEMERAEAKRLQPHFIASFFLEAFRKLGGTIRERESRRYEITRVPSAVRMRDRQIGTREAVLEKYERATFHKELISVEGKPVAAFLCPGHPLLNATIDLVLERFRDVLKTGAVLVDEQDHGTQPRVLFYLTHSIADHRETRHGERHVVSQRMQFVEVDEAGNVRGAGYAPYLDYRPAAEDELAQVAPVLDAAWLRADPEPQILGYAAQHLVPEHMSEVAKGREELIQKTLVAVKDRLTKEINYWDHRANELKLQEKAGKQPRSGMNSAKARERADELQGRLERRLAELERERQLSPLPPVVVGGALVIPLGLLDQLRGGAPTGVDQAARERIDQLAVATVMETERSLGREPIEMPHGNPGYDIESREPETGRLRFLEVKGKGEGATTVTVSKTQILTALNKPDDFILAIVPVEDDAARDPRYVWQPFQREPDFGVTSVNYGLHEILARSEEPS